MSIFLTLLACLNLTALGDLTKICVACEPVMGGNIWIKSNFSVLY